MKLIRINSSNNLTNEIFFDYLEDICIHKAISDLESDLEKVFDEKFSMLKYLPAIKSQCIVVGTLTNERFVDFLKKEDINILEIQHKWEHYLIKTSINGNLIICGSDPRGTMWGIYEFCEKFLGVDPLYFWTDNEPAKIGALELNDIEIIGGPKTYKFRGWFVNDEDFLMGWQYGTKNRENYKIINENYDKHGYQFILEKIVETALRMKQNLLIPCSRVDIYDAAEENLVRLITERGMFISQHHTEPLGVRPMTVEDYWKLKGVDINGSYVKYPEHFEEVWRRYVKKWAPYKNIIWQLGLRGRTDEPVWAGDENVPQSMAGRGNLISSAINKQYEIIKNEYGDSQVYSTATLWMEGMELHNEGYLNFPENSIIVNADFGPTQMWGEGYDSVKRYSDRNYGVYYHVGFWSCGPHLAQGNSTEKIYYNYKKAVEKKDTVFSILNVGNFREFVMEIKCIADITWNFDSYNNDAFLQNWGKQQFGSKVFDKIPMLYTDFFNAYHSLENDIIPGKMVLLDGMTRRVGFAMIDVLKSGDFRRIKVQNKKTLCFNSVQELVEYYTKATNDSLTKWMNVYSKIYEMLNLVDENRRQFFIDHFLVQTEIMMGLYSWLNYLCIAVYHKTVCENIDMCNANIRKAAHSLEQVLINRRKAEHGKWKNWYRGDLKADLVEMLQHTSELL